MIETGRDIKIFTGTMDQDTEARYMKEGDYRYLLNGRTAINSQGTFGAVEDVMGNVLVPNAALPPGTNKVIGSYEDIRNQSCIYFVYNSNGFHGIYRWIANSPLSPNGIVQTIYKVANPAAYSQFNPNPLNFQQNSLITGINLVDNLLFWTDGYNDPKCIDVVRANRTNKNQAFNLYFNPENLSTLTAYTINVYQDGIIAPVYTHTWISGSSTFASRVNDAIVLYAPNPYYTLLSETNYITIQMQNSNNYYVEVLNNTIYPDSVTAENFYPDSIFAGASYPPLKADILNNIKAPLYCHIDAKYNTAGLIQQSRFDFNIDIFRRQSCIVAYETSSVFNILNDPGNFVVAGAQVPATGFPITALAYVQNNTASPLTYTFDINYSGSYGPQQINSPRPPYTDCVGPYKIDLYLTKTPMSSIPTPNAWNETFLIYTNSAPALAPFSGSIPNTSTTVVFTLLPGEKITFIGVGDSAYLNIIGSVNMTVSQYQSVGPQIALIRPMFKARYLYKNNNYSVWSTATIVNIPNSIRFDTSVTLQITDKRIFNNAFYSEIKNLEIAVSYDGGTTYLLSNVLEPYEILNYGKVNFQYSEYLTPIPPEEITLLYHNVPLKAKSQEYIGDRLWYGNNTYGYESKNVKCLLQFQYISQTAINGIYPNTPYIQLSAWKRAWVGYIGIAYYDDYDRKTLVKLFEGSRIQVPDYYQTMDMLPAYLQLSIFNTPPSWATKYQVVRTNNLACNNYLMLLTNYTSYADSSFNLITSSGTDRKYIAINLDNITYMNNNNVAIEYTYTDGDRVKLIGYLGNSFSTFTPITQFNYLVDVPIAKAINNFIYIDVEYWPIGFGAGEGTFQYLMEIYTPYYERDSDEVLYYEFGQCFEIKETTINNQLVKYHAGNVVDQDLILSTPAVVDLVEGDVYYNWFRNFYYENVPSTWVQSGRKSAVIFVSSQSASQLTTYNFTGNDRINYLRSVANYDKFSSISFSNLYYSNTLSNGLNAFEPLNENQYNTEYGPINKLQVINNDILKLVFGNSYQMSIYVNQGVIRQSQGGPALVSVANEVAGNSHIIQRTLGTINGESIVVNDEGDMFGYDENEGVVWVSSGNGLIQISDRGMKSVFKRYSNERKATLAPSQTPSVYDLYHDEYIITLNDIQNAPGPVKTFPGVTIAYNKQKAGWTAYYSFVPEYYGRVRDYVVSFVKGQLYLHDRSTIAKNFYGTQYTRDLTYVTNKDFPKVRDFKAISINGIGMNDLPTIRVLPFEGYPNGMLSLLTKRFFKVLEGVQYAYFQKDKLTPGMQANQINALANGRNLKGQVLEVTLVNNDTTKSSLYSSEILYFYSEHS